MGKRLHSENIISLEGYTYVIEVYDSLHNSNSHEFVCEADGFQLIYENSGGELFKPINASRVEFSIYMKDAQIEQFYEDVITAAENRFLVKITRNGSLFWYGKIVADIGIKEDITRNNKPIYKVVALDGLGLLSQKEYNNNGVAYTGRERLFNHIKNCLGKIGTLGEFTSPTDAAIITVVEWHEDNMATGAVDDPLYLTRVAHESFWSVDSKGKKTYKNCLEVLEAICRIFGAKIYQANGAWRIEQVTERHNASIAEIRYDETGAALNYANVNYTINLDQATNAKLVGGEYTYYPPVREVNVTFLHENWRNLTPGVTFSAPGDSAQTGIADVDASSQTTLQITANVARTITYSSTPFVALFAVYYLEIKVGDKYLNRNITSVVAANITFEAPYWGNYGRYYFAFPYQTQGAGTQSFNNGIVINTPAINPGGQVQIRFAFHQFIKVFDGSPVSTNLSQTYNFSNIYTRVLYFGNYAEENIGVLYNTKSTLGLNNSDVVDIETNIGDEPWTGGTINRLEIWNGSAFVASNAWRNGVTNTYLPLLSLLGAEMIATLKNPVEKWLGTIKGQFDARHRFGWSSAHYIFLGGTLTARRDEWAGTYVKIAKDTGSIDVATPVSIGPTPGDGKTPFNPTQTPSSFADPNNNTTEMNVGGVVGSVMSHVSTLNSVGVGSVTSIPLSGAVNAGVFTAGQTVTIVNPFNGATQNLTVATTNLQGATTVAVSGYSAQAFPEGSYVLVSPQNWTLGDVPGGEDSTWWQIYDQHWSLDDTNEPQWPLEGYDTVLETNINAGNGSTAGIRFDGDGIAAYGSTSTYPRFAVSTAGVTRIIQSAHQTAQAGLLYVKDGLLYYASEEVLKMVPQYGHTKQLNVIGYQEAWTAGAKKPIIVFSSDYSSQKIYKIYWRLSFAGSNNNTCAIKLTNDVNTYTLGTITTAGALSGLITVTTNNNIMNDSYLYFDVGTITGNAPEGLTVEVFIQAQ